MILMMGTPKKGPLIVGNQATRFWDDKLDLQMLTQYLHHHTPEPWEDEKKGTPPILEPIGGSTTSFGYLYLYLPKSYILITRALWWIHVLGARQVGSEATGVLKNTELEPRACEPWSKFRIKGIR